MRSGIGPADHLSAVGVPVFADLPEVGINPGLEGEPGAAPRFYWLATFHSANAEPSGALDRAPWANDPVGALGSPIDVLVLTLQSRRSVRLRCTDRRNRRASSPLACIASASSTRRFSRRRPPGFPHLIAMMMAERLAEELQRAL
jgi:hypothetical protein